MGMKEFPKWIFLNNDQQEDITSLVGLSLSSGIKDPGTPQVHDFDCQAPRRRCRQPQGRPTLNSQRIPWKLVFKNETYGI